MYKMKNKLKIVDIDNLSNDYIADFTIFDKYTYSRIFERKKVQLKHAIKQIIDFLKQK